MTGFVQRLFLLLAAIGLLTACGKEPLYQEQGYVFGTLVEVSVYGEEEPRAKQAVAAVMQEFQRLHNLLHAWKPSPLSELNAAFAEGKPQEVTLEMAGMLQDAAELSAQSGGLFDPAVGGLVRLWGFHADEFKPLLPDEQALAALTKTHPQMSDLRIQGNTVSSRNKSVLLDLGGYAKGYALDRAAEILRQRGIQNALVNIGGNVIALGMHGKRPWRVGIQHPRKPAPIATLDLYDGDALGTSGDYQRFFELNGQRYCHIIDPRTGKPAQGVESVTVLTRGKHAGVLSDAASKPLFVAGLDGRSATTGPMHVPEFMLVDAKGNVHLTAGLQKRLEFTDKTIIRTVEP
jgi:thiamine biosynthesis lipoprotein